VIASTNPGARLSDLQPLWQRVRARAGLKDVRIRDLRHTFASSAVAGAGAHTVQSTARNAHLAADPVKEAAERVASNLAQAIGS
jgi:integrase